MSHLVSFDLNSSHSPHILWIQGVNSNAIGFSQENQKNLQELIKNVPNFESSSREIQESITKIYEIMKEEKWNQNLYKESAKALALLLS